MKPSSNSATAARIISAQDAQDGTPPVQVVITPPPPPRRVEPISTETPLGVPGRQSKIGQALLQLREHPGEWVVIPGVRRTEIERIKRVFRWRIEQKTVQTQVGDGVVTTTAYRFWRPL
jgi:hypothetical protein